MLTRSIIINLRIANLLLLMDLCSSAEPVALPFPMLVTHIDGVPQFYRKWFCGAWLSKYSSCRWTIYSTEDHHEEFARCVTTSISLYWFPKSEYKNTKYCVCSAFLLRKANLQCDGQFASCSCQKYLCSHVYRCAQMWRWFACDPIGDGTPSTCRDKW